VLFFPKPTKHKFRVDNPDGAELVCSTIDFGGGMEDPILRGLPDMVLVPLADVDGIDATLTMLFQEALGQRAARQAAINRLSEYFLLLLLRFAVEARVVAGGVLAGLGDPKLARAIHAINERPEHEWTLEALAKLSGMSRSRFAAHFHETTGITPTDYLTDWRISVAQTLLRQGKALKLVAPMVGYSSAIALTRAFDRRVGMTPGEWLKDA